METGTKTRRTQAVPGRWRYGTWIHCYYCWPWSRPAVRNIAARFQEPRIGAATCTVSLWSGWQLCEVLRSLWGENLAFTAVTKWRTSLPSVFLFLTILWVTTQIRLYLGRPAMSFILKVITNDDIKPMIINNMAVYCCWDMFPTSYCTTDNVHTWCLHIFKECSLKCTVEFDDGGRLREQEEGQGWLSDICTQNHPILKKGVILYCITPPPPCPMCIEGEQCWTCLSNNAFLHMGVATGRGHRCLTGSYKGR